LKRILFSEKADWVEPVRDRVDHTRFEIAFGDFHTMGAALDAFDCIVPLKLDDYEPLRARSGGRRNFLIPDGAVVEALDDKLQFLNFMNLNGFAELVPLLHRQTVAYPFIYKKIRDHAGRHSRIISTPEECEAFERRIRQRDYFKQAFVGGRNEYTTHFVSVRGKPLFDTTVEFAFNSDRFVRGVQNDPVSIGKVETPLRDVFATVLQALDYSGTSCFNYKIVDGKPKLFEINPRAGGSLRLDLNAYLDACLTALEA